MQTCDVVIVGGGPAGATCAWALGGAGVDVVLLDRERFPRSKPCAGWVTPSVFHALGITPADYASSGCTLQPFTAFETSVMGVHTLTTAFADPVSYGIIRAEFDTWLLRRVRTPVLEGAAVASLRRSHGDWIVNEAILAPIVVGAAGHFCPVSRYLRPPPRRVVLSRHTEIPIRPDARCGVSSTTPELYFCNDLEGYGWCLRKGNVLNVGLGRRTGAQFRAHVMAFATLLARRGRVPDQAVDWRQWRGHAYALAGESREVVADGLLLVGDAAGLAARESGEGIGPAIESGLAAADAVAAAGGRHSAADFQGYTDWVAAHAPARGLLARLRAHAPASLGRALMRSPAFARRALEQSFLGRRATRCP